MSEVVAAPAPDTSDPWTSQSADPAGAPDAPVVAEPVTPQPETEPAATAAETDAQAEQRARDEKGQFTSEADKATKPNRRKNPYEAVKEATGETLRERTAREAAERKAAELEREIAQLKAKPAEPQATPKADAPKAGRARPKLDDFADQPDPFDAYMEAVSDWKAEQRIQSELDARISQHFEQRQAGERLYQHVQSIREKGRAVYKDFDTAIQAVSDIQFPNDTLMAIVQMDGSEHIQYALATNRELAQRIAGWDISTLDKQIKLGAELAKLVPSSVVAATPDSTPPTRSSTAKPPINRVGGTASAVPVDPDDLDFGPEFIRAENERDKKRREAGRW